MVGHGIYKCLVRALDLIPGMGKTREAGNLKAGRDRAWVWGLPQAFFRTREFQAQRLTTGWGRPESHLPSD